MTSTADQNTKHEEMKTDDVAPSLVSNGKKDSTSNRVRIEMQSGADEYWTYPWPTDFKLSEHYIDDVPALKVCVIGAGLAGITAGVLLPAKVPGEL